MNQIEFPDPNGGSQRGTNVKSSSFTIENLLKPEKKRTGSECPVETPSKIKALSVAAHLAGLHFFFHLPFFQQYKCTVSFHERFVSVKLPIEICFSEIYPFTCRAGYNI